MLEAVVFDLYETLVTEYDPEWSPPRATISQRLGVDPAAFAAEYGARYERRMAGRFTDFASVLRDIVEALGGTPDEGLLRELQQERLSEKAKPFQRVEDDVIDALRQIEREGVRIGLISNCTADEVASWSAPPLASLIPDPVFSYEVASIKPNPRIYHLACDRLDVAPAATLFVGDGGSEELTGAARAGLVPCCALWFLRRWPGRGDLVDRRRSEHPSLDTLGDLIGLVDRLRRKGRE
ncbi:haloacid dehalogenase [Candidatus Poribacteria bacterium]|nr:haloacid dehalogenase [Candidatus Poribacteria bacterium]